jgi:hypothetical protein
MSGNELPAEHTITVSGVACERGAGRRGRRDDRGVTRPAVKMPTEAAAAMTAVVAAEAGGRGDKTVSLNLDPVQRYDGSAPS